MTHTPPLTASSVTELAAWRKSSYSDGAGQNCVEVADLSRTAFGVVAVRDSKVPAGPALLVTGAGFAAFVRGLCDADGGQPR